MAIMIDTLVVGLVMSLVLPGVIAGKLYGTVIKVSHPEIYRKIMKVCFIWFYISLVSSTFILIIWKTWLVDGLNFLYIFLLLWLIWISFGAIRRKELLHNYEIVKSETLNDFIVRLPLLLFIVLTIIQLIIVAGT